MPPVVSRWPICEPGGYSKALRGKTLKCVLRWAAGTAPKSYFNGRQAAAGRIGTDRLTAHPGEANMAPIASATTAARVLLVEDDQETADEVAAAFGEAGYQVTLVGDGPQGLALASGKAFDLVVLDHLLPGLDGLSLVAALRQAGVTTPGAADERAGRRR